LGSVKGTAAAGPESEAKTFAARLKRARVDRGWSQGELARHAGVHKNTVQRWESGDEDHPQEVQLQAVARALGKRAQWLSDAVKPENAESPLPSGSRAELLAMAADLRWNAMRILDRSIELELLARGIPADEVTPAGGGMSLRKARALLAELQAGETAPPGDAPLEDQRHTG
jgi:transcriptional regulator with XRE-family HTH domain